MSVTINKETREEILRLLTDALIQRGYYRYCREHNLTHADFLAKSDREQKAALAAGVLDVLLRRG